VSPLTGTRTVTKRGLGSGFPKTPGPNGNGSRKNGKPEWYGRGRRFPRGKYRVAIWMALASIVVMFGVLVVAYVTLSRNELWRPITVPKTFFVSTGLILLSSIAIEKARRALLHDEHRQYSLWLSGTLLLGLAFVVSQLVAWKQLIAEGVFLAGNPHSSFFYLFTGAHGLHLLGGMTALAYLTIRARRLLFGFEDERRQAATDAVSLYWHFMDGLWVSLFLLLWIWN
jgi:cytochrome c oxidase subunit III